MYGRAKPLVGLTPPAAIPLLERALHPFFGSYPHDADRARELWHAAGDGLSRPLRLATPQKLEPIAQHAATNIRTALGVEVAVTVYREHDELLRVRRGLAERTQPRIWDVLIWEHGAQEADGVALEFHHALAGALGEYRAGPVAPAFDALYAELQGETSKLKQAETTHRMDRFVYDEALAIFLCAPQALYAVNKQVDFTPYRTTFELAECHVSEQHWSRKRDKDASAEGAEAP